MQGFPDLAAKARDFARIYQLTGTTPVLGLPFCGPDRAAFYFYDRGPGAREDIAAAKQAFAGAFAVTFSGGKDIWSPNGPNREYKAALRSGVEIVLLARKADVQDEDAEVRELAEMAA